jgi:hypothetical protein
MAFRVLSVNVLLEISQDGDYTKSLVEDHLVSSYESLSILVTNKIAKYTRFCDYPIMQLCTKDALRNKIRNIKSNVEAYASDISDYMTLLETAWETKSGHQERLIFRAKEKILDEHCL